MSRVRLTLERGLASGGKRPGALLSHSAKDNLQKNPCALIRLLSVWVALRWRSLVLIASKIMMTGIQATVLVRFLCLSLLF